MTNINEGMKISIVVCTDMLISFKLLSRNVCTFSIMHLSVIRTQQSRTRVFQVSQS